MSNYSVNYDNKLIEQIIEALRPIDDALMRAMFKDDIPLVQLVLRIILDKNDLTLTEIETQRDLNKLAGGRSICLDAYATDSENRKYDIEIQRSDYGADAHRARYHLGALDTENLKAGQCFNELPETYVIFITENDNIGKRKPVYIFERYDKTNDEKLNDDSYIVYVNGEYRGDDDFGRLMHDFCCAVPEEMFFKEMSDRAKQFKEFKKENTKMNAAIERIINEHLERDPNPDSGLLGKLKDKWINKGKTEGLEKGKAEGIAATKKETALKMLSANAFSLEQVSEYSGLSVLEVEKLKADLNN